MRDGRRDAFTLVEMLVVIGIVGLLIAILLPTLNRARAAASRVACRAHLSDVGRLWQMYLNESRNRFPLVNPVPVSQPTLNNGPSPMELFDPYTQNARRGWTCPSDYIRTRTVATPPDKDTYFDWEGASFSYNAFLLPYAFRSVLDHPLYKQGKPDLLVIFSDFETFHGEPRTAGAMNFLFADNHVGDIEP